MPMYAYAVVVYSSRKIERRIREDVAFRYVAAENFPLTMQPAMTMIFDVLRSVYILHIACPRGRRFLPGDLDRRAYEFLDLMISNADVHNTFWTLLSFNTYRRNLERNSSLQNPPTQSLLFFLRWITSRRLRPLPCMLRLTGRALASSFHRRWTLPSPRLGIT
ncbi:MAG: hypothetical protein H0Z37_07520 [Firmicutes bacterium]|nr:hypothetical protein [Bacillota bacterium]